MNTIVTPAGSEPITTAEAKNHLKVDTTADDTLIASLITGVRQFTEDYLRMTLISTVWDSYFDSFPTGRVIKLDNPPLSAVTSVKYQDEDDNEQTLASSKYTVDLVSMKGRIQINEDEDWPDTYDKVNAVVIRHTSGYADADSVPDHIKQAMLLLIGDLYDKRQDYPRRLPTAAEWLLKPYRVYEF